MYSKTKIFNYLVQKNWSKPFFFLKDKNLLVFFKINGSNRTHETHKIRQYEMALVYIYNPHHYLLINT